MTIAQTDQILGRRDDPSPRAVVDQKKSEPDRVNVFYLLFAVYDIDLFISDA